MSTILTETDTFTANVPAPDDGDPATGASVTNGLQPLANRTKNLNTRTTALEKTFCFVEYFPASGTWAAGTKLDLTEHFDPQNVFSESSGDVTVPYQGYYKVTGNLRGEAATPNTVATIYVRKTASNEIPSTIYGNLADTATVEVVRDGVFCGMIFISDTSTDKINIYNADANDIDLEISPTGISRVLIEYMGTTP